MPGVGLPLGLVSKGHSPIQGGAYLSQAWGLRTLFGDMDVPFSGFCVHEENILPCFL